VKLPDIVDYLNSIRKKNGTYKRANLTPLRYAGAKNKAVGIILENIPSLKEKKIVSVFFGGGSVELVLDSIGYEVI
jgi:site-specific DNA-adenine methylase